MMQTMLRRAKRTVSSSRINHGHVFLQGDASRSRARYLHLVLPWETLRRLLGLPTGMALPSAIELTRMAIEEPRRARLIGMALMVHTPTEVPAAMLVAALER